MIDAPQWETLSDDDAAFVLNLFGAIENAKAEHVTLVTAYLIIKAVEGNLWMEA